MEAIELLKNIQQNMSKTVIGKENVTVLLLVSLLCKGHVLIEDIPGLGKTTIVESLAHSIDCTFRRIQFTPDVLPSDITGFSVYDMQSGKRRFQKGAVMGQIVLADEINRTSPKTQSALLEVMQENQITVDGVTLPMPQPFMVLATQNPIEFTGTYPLPEAQMDRFLMRVRIGYPSRRQEIEIMNRHFSDGALLPKDLQAVASADDVIALQTAVDEIRCADEVLEYIMDLVEATRQHADVLIGVSPRGSIGLLHAAKALALLSRRDYVTPDDVKRMAKPVLAHRLVLRPQVAANRYAAEAIIDDVLKSVSIPLVV